MAVQRAEALFDFEPTADVELELKVCPRFLVLYSELPVALYATSTEPLKDDMV